MEMNGFLLLADWINCFAMIFLLIKICRTKSCAGVSGKTQILQAIVFASRYADLLSSDHYHSWYATIMKVLLMSVTLCTVFLIYGPFGKKTYDRENDTFYSEVLLMPCFALALYFNDGMTPFEVLWAFSIYLEVVAIVPQCDLICKTGQIDTGLRFYLFLLCSYRALFVANWTVRYYEEGFCDYFAIFSGIVQTVIFTLLLIRIVTLRRTEKQIVISTIS